jgi:hypothetical protein
MRVKSLPAAKCNRATSRQAHADAAVASLIKDARAAAPLGKSVLVIDVGGTSVKILASGQSEIRSFRSPSVLANPDQRHTLRGPLRTFALTLTLMRSREP